MNRADNKQANSLPGLHRVHLDDLRRSGLSDEMIVRMGCKSTDEATIEKSTGKKRSGAGYSIPYAGTLDQTGQPYMRYRLDTTADGKYASGVGEDPQIYTPPGFDALPAGGMLVITEGEKKASKAVQDGICCVAIQGVHCGFDPGIRAAEKAQGMGITEHSLPHARLLELSKGRDLVVVFGDSDVVTNPSSKHAVETLAASLRRRGVYAVAAYCPPRVEVKDGHVDISKQGLDDFLISRGGHVRYDLRALAFAAEVGRGGITDSLNAKYLNRLFNEELVYSRGEWHGWTGQRWISDEAGCRRQKIERVSDEYRSFVTSLFVLKRQVGLTTNSKEQLQEPAQRWIGFVDRAIVEGEKAAERIANLRTMEAAFTVAQGPLGQPSDIWDRDPELLGVENGVVNLRTGELLEPRPDHFITRTAGTYHDAAATCPSFLAFLTEMQPDAEVRAFLQVLAGYCLTGYATEQKLFIFQGSGDNGKSLFMNLMIAAMGTYAMKAPPSLLAPPTSDRPRNDVAAMMGKRMVSSSETKANSPIDESLMKALTGNEMISARFLNKEFFEFKPQFTAILDTNFAPRFRETGHAMERRVRVVPWPVRVPEEKKDTDLFLKLQKELPGILAWMIAGAARYLRSGLQEPPAVLHASKSHMQECNPFSRWSAENLLFQPNQRTKSADLMASYAAWAREEDEAPTTSKALTGQLRALGLEAAKMDGGLSGWKGVGLRSQATEPTSRSDQGAVALSAMTAKSASVQTTTAACQMSLGGNVIV